MYLHFVAVGQRARKFAKAEVKTLVDDYEAKLEEARSKHCEDQTSYVLDSHRAWI